VIPSSISEAIARKLQFADVHSYQTGCDGKVPYDTWKAAKRAARAMHKQFHKAFDIYRCRFCEQFHIGGRRRSMRLREVG
jgi:hypothetical protein